MQNEYLKIENDLELLNNLKLKLNEFVSELQTLEDNGVGVMITIEENSIQNTRHIAYNHFKKIAMRISAGRSYEVSLH